MSPIASIRRLFALSAALGVVVTASSVGADAPPGRYLIANETVYDTKTALTWQRVAAGTKYPWGAPTTNDTAQWYCANLTLNSQSWRLPTVKELATIIDFSRPSPAALDSAFSGPTGPYWSATPMFNSQDGGVATQAWLINFQFGSVNYDFMTTSYSVRCVR